VADPEFEVEVAARLEQEARRLLDSGAPRRELVLALAELRADRANGESLGPAIDHLRGVLDRLGNT
jgi:hypothetical protein